MIPIPDELRAAFAWIVGNPSDPRFGNELASFWADPEQRQRFELATNKVQWSFEAMQVLADWLENWSHPVKVKKLDQDMRVWVNGLCYKAWELLMAGWGSLEVEDKGNGYSVVVMATELEQIKEAI